MIDHQFAYCLANSSCRFGINPGINGSYFPKIWIGLYGLNSILIANKLVKPPITATTTTINSIFTQNSPMKFLLLLLEIKA
ncbi:UNVERIFIED_ORG: hypothetical protein QFZ59_004307 [Bacillus sp. B2I3]|nr:hypothetical protein [Bacillus sp. B2I3]